MNGTTYGGGANGGDGTVFEISTSGKTSKTLYNFAGSPTDGANPSASLLGGPDGNLYGTTSFGGILPQPNIAVAGMVFQLQTLLLPIITSFAPAKAKVGATVTVTGLNLANATSVMINGVAQTITFYAAKTSSSR